MLPNCISKKIKELNMVSINLEPFKVNSFIHKFAINNFSFKLVKSFAFPFCVTYSFSLIIEN